MPVRPCPDALDCPPDQPLDNFSSESDDTLDFISTFFSGRTPPLLKEWTALKCDVTFLSRISQLDADQQAQASAITCINPGIFTNAPQTFCVTCPSGTQSCYTVPAGLITGNSQAEADSAALNLAQTLVPRNLVCFSNIEQCGCINTPYNAIITSVVPVLWAVTGGSLPPGISFGGSLTVGVLSGVPTVAGTYTFQITGVSPQGPIGVHTFIITILEITTTQLDAFSVGNPYSFQLQATGGSGNYLWRIVSGSLPPGLVLDNTGLIHGTPQ